MDRCIAALIIFIRNPIPGTGKTRIAEKSGKKKAHEIYLELLAATRSLAESYPGPKYLFYSDFIDHADDWDGMVYRKRIQAGGGLGEKMASAFQEVLIEHPAAIIIGSDCPALEPGDLEEACRATEQHDLVIGPSEDGGYYLLGMRRFYPSLFSGIPWSSAVTFAKTVENAARLNLHVGMLRQLYDIDTTEDWHRWKKESWANRLHASRYKP